MEFWYQLKLEICKIYNQVIYLSGEPMYNVRVVYHLINKLMPGI